MYNVRKFKGQLVVISYFFSRLLGGSGGQTLASVARQVNTHFTHVNRALCKIYSEDENLAKVPVKIPAEIQKIKYWGNRNRESVRKHLKSEHVRLQPAVSYVLDKVFLCNSAIFIERFCHRVNFAKFADYYVFSTPEEYQEAVFAHNYFSGGFWGHWLMSELAMQYGMKNTAPMVGHSIRVPFRDEYFWREMLQLPNIIGYKTLWVDKLHVANPTALDPVTIKNWFLIRQDLGTEFNAGKLVYVKRDSSGQQRTLTNEGELIDRLVGLGFEIFDLSGKKGSELYEAVNCADIVVGVEGSHMDPALYTISNSGLLIILQPPGRVSLNTVTNAGVCGVSSAAYICDFGSSFYDFSVNIDEFLGFFDRACIWHNGKKGGDPASTLKKELRIDG